MLNPKTTTRDFMTKSKQLFIEGRQKFPEQPYLMKTYLGNATILPTQMLDEVRNMTEIDFWPAVEKVRESPRATSRQYELTTQRHER